MDRLLPQATATSAPFWDGLRREEIRVQQCADCGNFVFYPRSNCSHCLSDRLEWRRVSGRGTVHSFSISRVPTLIEFRDRVPQLLAVIELTEGVRINSVLVGTPPEDIAIGMSVEPVFAHGAEGEPTLLHFTPAAQGQNRGAE
jgi:uncharacterized OB-fold protein